MKTPRIPTLWRLLAFLAGFLICLGIVRNWNLHARLALLLRGHVFCELTAPGDYKPVSAHNTNHLLVSRTVYSNGKYIGFLDSFGQFIPKESNTPDEARLRSATVVLFCAMYAFAASFVVTGVLAFRRFVENVNKQCKS